MKKKKRKKKTVEYPFQFKTLFKQLPKSFVLTLNASSRHTPSHDHYSHHSPASYPPPLQLRLLRKFRIPLEIPCRDGQNTQLPYLSENTDTKYYSYQK